MLPWRIGWGLVAIKWELEDLAFRYLNEVEFYKISHLMNEKRREREALVDEWFIRLKLILLSVGLTWGNLRTSQTYLFHLSEDAGQEKTF